MLQLRVGAGRRSWPVPWLTVPWLTVPWLTVPWLTGALAAGVARTTPRRAA
jgi:hypothetical protein